jgi:hypothetical protein
MSIDQASSQFRQRVWLRAFWGFSPEDEGYLGFTHEGNRARFLKEYREGDLVLIYGADHKLTRIEQRRQLLGFLEVEPRPITDTERSSVNDRRWREENAFLDRWTFALPVTRAWRINRRVEAQHFVPHAFAAYEAMLIASRGELLSAEESEAVLKLPTTPTDVFGMPPLSPEEKSVEATLKAFFEPSRGVTPSFGTRTLIVEDAENCLYALALEGNTAAFLGRQPYEVSRRRVVKIGIAKDPQVRCDTHNKHIPQACAFNWKLLLTSTPFPGAAQAKEAEDALKKFLANKFESLGGEFFLVEEQSFAAEFSKISPPKFLIKALS